MKSVESADVFMNRETLNSILTGALGVSLAFSAIACIQYTIRTHNLRKLGADVAVMNAAKSRMQTLGFVCTEYAKTNTGLDTILRANNVDPQAIRNAAKSTTK
jgi:hypothetical protein